jgi:hypothetical protein
MAEPDDRPGDVDELLHRAATWDGDWPGELIADLAAALLVQSRDAQHLHAALDAVWRYDDGWVWDDIDGVWRRDGESEAPAEPDAVRTVLSLVAGRRPE